MKTTYWMAIGFYFLFFICNGLGDFASHKIFDTALNSQLENQVSAFGFTIMWLLTRDK